MASQTTAPIAASDYTPMYRAPRPVVLRHRLEYVAMRGTVGAIGGLGLRRASALGGRIGRLGYSPLGIRRTVVEKQIAAAFPEWEQERVETVARAAYENLGRTAIETATLSRYGRDALLDLFDESPSWHVVESALARGRGVILVASHHGNWEFSAAYVAARGVHTEVVARQQENPLFDDWLTRTRNRIGTNPIYDGDAVRRVPRVLRAGGGVALVIDQGGANLASTWVPFFGRLAKTPRGPAVFALRLQTPVVFVNALRKPDGGFTANFEEIPVQDTGDKVADVTRILTDCSAVLERWVRKVPEQYFWHHRRWKHQQPNTPPELGNPL